jgi:hypothetical protein
MTTAKKDDLHTAALRYVAGAPLEDVVEFLNALATELEYRRVRTAETEAVAEAMRILRGEDSDQP